MNTESKSWLCRNCNTEVQYDLTKCPRCSAERPEAVATEETDEAIVVESNEVAAPQQKRKYIFRESVLINAADILLILGIFCSFGALISPMFLEDNIQHITTLSIVMGVGIFLGSTVMWALFRNIAEISRMLREREEKEQNS